MLQLKREVTSELQTALEDGRLEQVLRAKGPEGPVGCYLTCILAICTSYKACWCGGTPPMVWFTPWKAEVNRYERQKGVTLEISALLIGKAKPIKCKVAQGNVAHQAYNIL